MLQTAVQIKPGEITTNHFDWWHIFVIFILTHAVFLFSSFSVWQCKGIKGLLRCNLLWSQTFNDLWRSVSISDIYYCWVIRGVEPGAGKTSRFYILNISLQFQEIRLGNFVTAPAQQLWSVLVTKVRAFSKVSSYTFSCSPTSLNLMCSKGYFERELGSICMKLKR